MLQNVNHDVQYTGLTFFYNYFLLYFSDGHAQISGKDICIYNIQEQVSSLVSTLAVFSAELKKKKKKKKEAVLISLVWAKENWGLNVFIPSFAIFNTYATTKGHFGDCVPLF